MVQLAKKQTALVLYSVLVVLPAAVFGGLHWFQLVTDHKNQLEEIPENAAGAADRMLRGMRDRLDALIDSEQERPFFHYQKEFFQEGRSDDLPFLPSPLLTDDPPPGVVAWFGYDYIDGRDAEVEIFAPQAAQPSEVWPEGERLRRFITALAKREFRQRLEITMTRRNEVRKGKMSLRMAAVNRSPHKDPDCLRLDVTALAELAGETVDVRHWNLNLRLLREMDRTPRIVAMRFVDIETQIKPTELPECFEALRYETELVQGFFIDPNWLLVEMPQLVAQRVLDGSQRFLLGSHTRSELSPTDTVVEIPFFEELGFEVELPEDMELGVMKVVVSTEELERRYRGQAWRFLGVAAMMVISLTIGMGLLVRSVRSSLEQARRTENFIASVSHELRTPIAAVKLYGEMLRDGWISDKDKQEDYLSRIILETNRLDSLVDNVLQKRRLGDETIEPEPGDLAEAIESQIPELKLTAGTYGEDVSFDIEPNLPPVLLIEEAVHAILVNLVENARKYAPVDRRAKDAEPILVCARFAKGKVLMEVMDRGPGIPEEERGRIFEAFYRVGDERTRTTRGTGLGLHLVALQARAMKARVQALPRRGGGSVFRITFKTLKHGARA